MTFMTLPPSMTLEQLFVNFKAVMQNRLNRNNPPPSQAARSLFNTLSLSNAAQTAQQLLNLTVAQANPQTESPGPCLYVVNNNNFCLSNLTPTECQALGGKHIDTCTGLPQWPGSGGG
jgi:hypothetical protein